MRPQWRELLQGEVLPIQMAGREWTLYTFAGDRINILLGRALAQVLECEVTWDSYSLSIKSKSQLVIQESHL